MTASPDPAQVAAALRLSVGLLVRRLRQIRGDNELTLPETSALARLDRAGSLTGAALARLDQISPQSMGATLATLQDRGLIKRAGDPLDGRQVILSLTKAGKEVLESRRDAKVQQLARALAEDFTPAELRQLMAAAPLLERLAQRI